jgi:spore photoproduct lyase
MNTIKSKKINYQQKFESFRNKTLFEKLDIVQQEFLKNIAFNFRFTFQEFRQVVEAARDLELWQETDLKSWWQDKLTSVSQNNKHIFLSELKAFLSQFKSNPTVYPIEGLTKPVLRKSKKIKVEKSDKEIYGMCPVASPKTVCCNLRTIDAVENCVFGCSYCTIQTFYTQEAIFDAELENKLNNIQIDPNRFYHFGSGQSSDSLAWGNREGNLDALCNFAKNNPNILLEFKTKSNNISYFLENDVSKNIVCSFSLNTDTIVNNEEHFTASLAERINAANKLAEHGIKVAFHFHPMVYYDNWENDYSDIANTLTNTFKSDAVLFISFGSVTLIKPVIQKIRNLGNFTKTLQMELVPDPHGKLTYHDEVKIRMFSKMYQNFEKWHDKVFIYLCMEKAEIWEKSFGYVYNSNEEFEADLGATTMTKIKD